MQIRIFRFLIFSCVLIFVCYSDIFAQTARSIPATYGTGIIRSYVRTWDAAAPEQSPNTLVTRNLRDVKQSTQYVDGLGRAIQSVAKQGSYPTGGSAVDLVSMVEYDGLGRESFRYLPTAANGAGGNTSITDGNFKLNPFEQQASFYNSTSSPVYGQGETFFYGQNIFEPSPLNRMMESAPAGNSWAGSMWNGVEANRHSVKMKYYQNTVTDAVRIWTVAIGALGSFSSYSSSGAYGANLLNKTISVDEHGKQIIEFKDKTGRIVLKKVQLTASSDDGSGSGHLGWLCTYYLYDDLGNLRCVIQPRGVELISSSWVLTDPTILAEQCFRYEYDQLTHVIIKKIPGAKETYMVYDKSGRMVMSQDANLRVANKWLVTLYDGLNRPVQTGLLLNTWNDHTFTEHLSSASSSTAYPFTSSSTPSVTFWEYLAKTGYDNYSSIPAASGLSGTIDLTYATSTYGFFTTYNSTPDYAQPVPSSSSIYTKGLVTWTERKVLGTSTYVYAVSIYDDKGRLIQVKSKNITGGFDLLTTQYNWTGQPLVTVTKQEKAGTPAQTTVTISKYSYDDLGRLVQTDKKVQNTNVNSNALPSTYTTIAKSEYDAIGQLKKKKLGNKPGAPGSPLANLAYEYNIRGWLTSINKNFVGSSTNNDEWFGMELGYDKNASLGSFTPLFNGNIAGVIWKSEGDKEKRKYDFTYDVVNRLTSAGFTQYVSGSGSGAVFNTSAGVDFSVSNLAYDANGNIQSMWQMGLKLSSSTYIDQLAYTYSPNTNRLQKVDDGITASDNGKLGDFKDGTNTGIPDYSQDDNGNLSYDKNKDISSITYNYLNLPSIIITSKGTITYTYDATGGKQKKVTQENGATVPLNGTNYTTNITTTTLYLGGEIFESKSYSNASLSSLVYTDRLQFLAQEEGRIRFKSQNSSLQYDYMIKDHLGNVRMLLTEEQQQDIYPAATLEGTYTDGNTAIGYEKNFYTINASNVVDNSQAAGISSYQNNNGIANPYPAGNSGNTNVNANSTKLYKLISSGGVGVNGLGMTLKVMSGDKIDIMGKSYYTTLNTGGLNYAVPVLDIITGLLGASGGTAALKGFTSTDLNGSSTITTPIYNYLGDPGRSNGSVPKAYINWILFDENFKYVNGNYSQVGTAGVVKTHYGDAALQNIQVTKNGYLYVYVSNESPVAVFFDNLQVIHTRGPILEDTHYYPFGLTMAGISSARLPNNTPNNYRYNGQELQNSEFNDQSGLQTYDYGARMNDPQLGRFWQIDPKSEVFSHINPYNYCFNNPLIYVDPDGMQATYNWNTGQYEDTDEFGNTIAVTWWDVQKQYGIGPFQRTNSVMLAPKYESDGKTVKFDYGTGALKIMIDAALKTGNIKVLHVDDANDAANQIERLDEYITNLFILSHGDAKDGPDHQAYFAIGATFFHSQDIAKSKALGRIAARLAGSPGPMPSTAQVVVFACGAGGTYNGGVAMLEALAKKLHATVFGSQSCSRASSDIFSNGGSPSFTTSDWPDGHPKNPGKYSQAYLNTGRWTMVSEYGGNVVSTTVTNVFFDAYGRIHYTQE